MLGTGDTRQLAWDGGGLQPTLATEKSRKDGARRIYQGWGTALAIPPIRAIKLREWMGHGNLLNLWDRLWVRLSG